MHEVVQLCMRGRGRIVQIYSNMMWQSLSLLTARTGDSACLVAFSATHPGVSERHVHLEYTGFGFSMCIVMLEAHGLGCVGSYIHNACDGGHYDHHSCANIASRKASSGTGHL
jgi:hypothetical protein